MSEIRLSPLEAANLFVNAHFPHCLAALLGGSVIRNDATATSDLDIVIFDQEIVASYRESLIQFGWPIEVFVHNKNSYKTFFESDVKRGRPSLPRMVAEGVAIIENGLIDEVKKEARSLLMKGPEKWSDETIMVKRYFITDALDDFIGSTNRSEGLFVAATLADLLHEFYLRTKQKWIGSSKWIVRSLKEHNEEFAHQFVDAFEAFYQNNEREAVITLADEVLSPYGGRLFDGFLLGKREKRKNVSL
jgi:hypothetical protein